MQCIYCQGETSVVNSRHQRRTNSVWRRRRCASCNSVFTSIEAADLSATIMVRKPTAIERFSRDKLLLSVYDSLRHRKTAVEDSKSLTDTIISKLFVHIRDAGVDVLVITEVTLVVLQRFDKVAATHYAAFHPIAPIGG